MSATIRSDIGEVEFTATPEGIVLRTTTPSGSLHLLLSSDLSQEVARLVIALFEAAEDGVRALADARKRAAAGNAT